MAVATVRGADGAGITIVPCQPKKPLDILRQRCTAAELAYSYDFYGIMKKVDPSCLMGHARLPTSGSLDVDGCHPHKCGDIIGMHNGTMDWIGNQKVGKNDTDSLMLFDAISKQGAEHVLKNSLGAYALAFINKATDTLNFARNKARPLSFAQYQDEPKYLYWASEQAMLSYVLHRNRPSASVTYYDLPKDELVSFRLHSTQDIKPLNRVDLTRKAVQPIASVPSITQDNKVFSTVHNHYLPHEDMIKCLASGCCYCNDGFSLEDYHNKKMTFFSRDEFICNECLALDETARDYIKSCGIELPNNVIPVPSLLH